MFLSTIKIRTILLMLLSVFYILWGTSWELPLINIPTSYILIGVLLITIFLLPGQSLKKERLMPFILFASVIFFTTPIGLSLVLSSNDVARDLNYLVMYDLKILINVFLLFAILRIFKNREDFHQFSFMISVLISIIAPFLIWKYIFVFKVSYIGVTLDEPLRVGKNSFATALVLMFPIILINLKKYGWYRFFSYLAILNLTALVILVNSRSMVIIFFFLCLFLLFFSEIKRKKLILSFAIPAIAISLVTVNLLDFLTKSGSFSDGFSGTENPTVQYLVESHRGWLIQEAIVGTIRNNGLPHGTSTFRIRPTNQFSRTETHNDYLTVLYEQGVIGLLLLLFLFASRIYYSLKSYRRNKDPIMLASIATLIGLFLCMIFMNIIQTVIFWLLFGINLSLDKDQKSKDLIMDT